MPDRDLNTRTDTPVGNFAFEVKINGLSGELPLELGVDAVRGLGDARTGVIRHRTSGVSATTQTPYPGLSTPDSVTLEGSWFYDMNDIERLDGWRKQVKGDIIPSAIEGIYRDVTIHLTVDNEMLVDIFTGGKVIKLLNAIAVRFSFSDFDINSPAFSSWSLELEYEEMQILGG